MRKRKKKIPWDSVKIFVRLYVICNFITQAIHVCSHHGSAICMCATYALASNKIRRVDCVDKYLMSGRREIHVHLGALHVACIN